MRTLHFPLVISMIVVMSPTRGFGEYVPRPHPVPQEGVKDDAPSLSADAKVVAWFHREGWKTEIRVVQGNWKGNAQSIPVQTHPHANLAPVLSGDGKHVFWSENDRVKHVALDRIPFAVGDTGVSAGPFGLYSNQDGSRLAFLVDGPDTESRSPGWRDVGAAALKDGVWHVLSVRKEQATDVETFHLSSDADVKRLVYTRNNRVIELVESSAGWTERTISLDGLKERIDGLTLSSDGRTLLIDARGIYVSRRDKEAWSAPRRVVEDKTVSVYEAAMTRDGKTAVWVHYTRADKDEITKTEIRALALDSANAVPVVVAQPPGHPQLLRFALGAKSGVAYSVVVPGAGMSSKVFGRETLDGKSKEISFSR